MDMSSMMNLIVGAMGSQAAGQGGKGMSQQEQTEPTTTVIMQKEGPETFRSPYMHMPRNFQLMTDEEREKFLKILEAEKMKEL